MAEVIVRGVLSPSVQRACAGYAQTAEAAKKPAESPSSVLDMSYAKFSQEDLTDTDRGHAAKYLDGNDEEHRCKDCGHYPSFYGLVVRSISPSSAEFHSDRGKAAIDKEITDLRKEGTWDESSVAEWSKVRQIRHNGFTPMSGLLFIIMGQKNSELVGTVPDSECPFRARGVFQGSNIRTGDGTPPWMLYQEVGATPSSMASAHCALGIGALKGSTFSTRDAEKAYIQSDIDKPGRPRTWIRLPKFLWPKSWFEKDGTPKYYDPVCILRKALYGHPESGPMWDKKMHKVMKDCEFIPVGGGSPGVFYNPHYGAEMVVYVDDFILIAPEHLHAKIWASLDRHIKFKDPGAPVTRFLGVQHDIIHSKDGMCSMTTEGKEYLQSAVKEYMQEIGVSSLPWAVSYTHLTLPTTPYV